MLLSLLFSFLQAPVAEQAPTPAAPPFDHVLLVSVDGLRSDALLVNGGEGLPNFQRLLLGAHTLNARCDPEYSVTLPNHADMLTGRLAGGLGGHGWTTNIDPPAEAKFLDAEGAIIPGIYHQTSAAGIEGAFIVSKAKFLLFTQSWNADLDSRVMDFALVQDDVEAQMQLVFRMLDTQLHPRTFTFLHLRGPDDAGHASGWDLTPGSPYLNAVQAADQQIGRILHFLDQNPGLRAKTAIVVTSDHGGGVPHSNHYGPGMMWINTIIPFFVDLPQGKQVELYELCADTRRNPGIDPVANQAGQLPPIRNADVANLCLALLGLDPMPGSTVNVGQAITHALFPLSSHPPRNAR